MLKNMNMRRKYLLSALQMSVGQGGFRYNICQKAIPSAYFNRSEEESS